MSNSSVCCVFESPILIKVLPPILFMEFIFGLTGNIVALCMFFFQVDSWKPNSIYLAHLAVADSMVLFFMPFRADYYIRGQNWIFGDAFCRILLFAVAANRAASIFFLTAVAVDRYLKIVHPLHRLNRMNLRYAMWVSAGLWAIVLLMTTQLLGLPHFFSLGNHTQCESFNICFDNSLSSIWHNTFYLIQFFVPGGIIIFCTACITWQLKTKTMDNTGKIKRAVHFIFVVTMVFLISFFPSTASRVAISVLKAWYHECSHFKEANLVFYFSLCFTYFNSTLNPLVYYFSTPAFSGILQKFFKRLTGQKEEVAS
ncbi:hydroxycarboxylic acid receptor 2-like [Pangasianodon hypophthalmus]|uniref:hydroxycarboxylic acid receptor 2-like n=1 Tax=Pangasianodon hypophthalmus TaxID=310915 RepID=UPI000F00E0EE|nr:hydroxycarboxylic acid receptor 2-like [Pangasianodon hypophthalmus]